MKMFGKALAILALTFATGGIADAQTANGRATTDAPTYTDGTPAPLSLDTAGNLRVNCVTGCDGGGGGGGGGNVNINAVGGNPVTTDIPVSIDTLPAGSNALGTVGVTALPELPTGSNTIGNVGVVSLPALPAGSNAIGNVGVTSLPELPAGGNLIGSVHVSNISSPTVGHAKVAAAGTNATVVFPTPARLTGIQVYNNTENIYYLKLYNKGTAPSCGVDVPEMVILIPGGQNGAGSNVSFAMPTDFPSGISYCTVNGIANNATGGVAANAVAVNIQYAPGI